MGKNGASITFINEKNKPLVKPLYSLLLESNQEIPRWFEAMYNSVVTMKPIGRGRKKGNFAAHDFRKNNSGLARPFRSSF